VRLQAGAAGRGAPGRWKAGSSFSATRIILNFNVSNEVKVVIFNTWPTKGGPWLIEDDITPREAYDLAKAVRSFAAEAEGTYAKAPRNWFRPRYIEVAYVIEGGRVRVLGMKGRDVWRVPGGVWKRDLFYRAAEALNYFFGAAAQARRCSL